MQWIKLGRISFPEESGSQISYSAVPVALHLAGDIYRIFLSNRDSENRSIPFFIDFDIKVNKVSRISTRPLMGLGKLGTFDDSGVMPTCLLQSGADLLMYYIGWNTCKTVPFRNAIGLARSHDKGETFTRVYEGPILDRTAKEPYFCASCHVMEENSKYKIWYLNCTRWEKTADKPVHFYHIKYAESTDGINFHREGTIAIDFKNSSEYAISVPRVIKEDGIYNMWYSYRGEYYKIGYAESKDGINWTRKDDEAGIDISKEGWDSEMICYPFVFNHGDQKYMLYNGNGYGRSGVGLAMLQN